MTGAERFFIAEVMTAVLDGRCPVISVSRRRGDGGIDVLPEGDGREWLALDDPQIRVALNNLSTAHPGYTVQCAHLQRVDDLVDSLAQNKESAFDACLVDAVVQMAVTGVVDCSLPDDLDRDRQVADGSEAASL